MEEPFILTVVHNGKQHDFETQLILTGYTHKFRVVFIELNMSIFFERDEEGSYRAVLPPEVTEQEAGKIDKGLLQAIAEKIAILKGWFLVKHGALVA